jgi:hypothetical protein
MVAGFLSRKAYPVGRRVVGENALEVGWRLKVAALLFLTGLMFGLPPAVAVLVLVGAIR